MSKPIIEQALQQAIATNNIHQVALTGGNEDLFTKPMVNYIPNCYEQVKTFLPPNFIRWKNIDLVTFQPHPLVLQKPVIDNVQNFNIDWALEAKHYTPHQKGILIDYLHWSTGGCIKDALKLVDCEFDKFYILQLQTHITHFTLLGGATYQDLKNESPFFRIYLNYGNTVAANANINRVLVQNRIVELIRYAKQHLDKNLIYGCSLHTVPSTVANVDVALHYLISGPFYRADILPRIVAQLGPNGPYEDMVGGPGQITTWDFDVSIESDPEG